MLNATFQELVFIRISIALLRYTVPLLLTYLCLHALLLRPASLAWTAWYNRIIIGYCIVDVLYAALVWYPLNRRLRSEAQRPTPVSRAERRALLEKCLDHIQDPGHYLRLWFLGAEDSEIRRENVREFILWAFFDKSPGMEPDSEDEEEEIEEYLQLTEVKMQRTFPPGRGQAKCLRLSIDAVETAYRTAFWWVMVGAVDMITHSLLAWQGYQYYAQSRTRGTNLIPFRLQNFLPYARSESKEMAYWHRPHTAPDKIPFVYLHGVGIGLWPYVPFFCKLANHEPEDAQTGVIAIEMLPVSFRLTGDPLQKLVFLDNMARILDARGWSRFNLVTHSYGSVVATHMLKSPILGPRVEAAVLIDPVSILLHLPDVAYNFTRRRPKRANEWQLWYFASTDPGVAYCLGRHLHWKESIAWTEDLLYLPQASASNGSDPAKRTRTRRVAVCLAERDLIVDTLAVARYLTGDDKWQPSSTTLKSSSAAQHVEYVSRNGIEVAWFPGLDHAQVFDYVPTTEEICRLVQRYCSVGQEAEDDQ